MNDTSKNILLSDVQGQGFLSIFNDLSSELMPHELSLLELMEGLDYEGFDSSLRRDASVDPKDMAIIIVYSYMMGHTSSRSIERLCRRDLFIVSVLRGTPAPDHTTINRFIKRNGKQIEDIFYQVVNKLGDKGELGRETVFQDGTKIESRAGKYTFVWKGFVEKNAEKCEARLRKLLRKANRLGLSILCEEGLDFTSVYTELLDVKGRIEDLGLDLDAPTGRGRRLDPRVKLYRLVSEDLRKIARVGSGEDKRSGSSYGVYRSCESCGGCPLKDKCMKTSKKESKEFQAYVEHWDLREKARNLLESDKGVEIRVNRSIMAEGSFAQMKGNNKLRRFSSFGMERAFTEWLLMALAVNVKHYANRRYNYNLDDPDWYEKKPA